MHGSDATRTTYGAASLGLGITRKLCGVLAGVTFADLPADAVHAGRRGLLDWLGCALAGSGHPTLDTLITVLDDLGSRPDATVLGRGLRLGLNEAALANGQMGHLLDYDDTHMGGVVLHASSPILSALLALADRRGASGADLITAYAAGFEAGVRSGQGAPEHHDGGWHLTGTLGTIAAGAAAGRLIGLDAARLTHAVGIAATQAAGMQQNRGTMCKSFHAGRAGSNGLLAALLAERGFDSSDEILEGKRGFTRIYSRTAAPERILDGLGTRWEIARNGHKPYACGVVLHPLIDAVIAARALADAAPARSIELRVHPHAVTITGVADPGTGLKSKFSINHSAAVAYLDGAASPWQFSDERATSPDVVDLRSRVSVTVDESFRRDQATAIVTTSEGCFEAPVAHASGTIDNPMSDAAIMAKFEANAVPVIGAERASRIAAMVWDLDRLRDVRELTALCA